MSEGKDYSDYIKHMSNLVSGLFFIGGFLLTIITLLITQLPDPSTLTTQLVLLFLLIFFNIVGFLAIYLTIDVIYFCKDIPPYSPKYRALNIVMFLAATFWGLAVAFLLLLLNLPYLTLASFILWILNFSLSYIFIWKPFQRYRKRHQLKNA